MSETLPIESLRPGFLDALELGPVVVTSPTGSGKSTQVPRWCPGRVLVVEPRRVACRSLAQRVAQLEGTRLGGAVGYRVRNEHRAGGATRVLFATPGVVLRIFDSLAGFDTVVLDELHERGLEVDLLLALLRDSFPGRLVTMSATLDGDRLAAHLGGRHLRAEGRVYPVELRYRAGDALLPAARGLEQRVRGAVEASRGDPGDVLVFLPGKAEIAACTGALAGLSGLEVLELHGGLSLEQQSRAFLPCPRRKVVLATNVAETSITLPGVGVVIDSGLVRQTRYHRGRGFLTLVPVARDSAEQRCGRAGRTAPGVCYRLWDEAAQLEARTLPEVHRESLLPLVLAAAACGARVEELPFFDPPREHALESAREELAALAAIDADGRLTSWGRRLFALPLDAPLGRLVVEARSRDADGTGGLLEDVLDLVSVLAVGRSLFARGPRPDEDSDDDAAYCDATLTLRALRRGGKGARVNAQVLAEARATRRRLRAACGLPERAATIDRPVDRKQLAMAVLAADPRAAHVARRRGRRVGWSNGGTEIELGRDSAVGGLENVEAIAVLATMALGLGRRDTRVLATCVMPLPLGWLEEAGLGRDRMAEAVVEEGRVVARIERVYARRVLARRQEVPRGEAARHALAELFSRGAVFPEAARQSREHLQAAALASRLGSQTWREAARTLHGGPVPSFEEWLAARLATLGVDSGGDLELLDARDLLAPDLPAELRAELDRRFPRSLTLLGTVYEITYDAARREVTLNQVKGRRTEPAVAYLPHFAGFKVLLRHRDLLRTLRR